MKNTKALCLLVMLTVSGTLSLTLMMTAPSVNASVPSSIGSLEGPYFKEIRFKIYATSEAEVAGLLAGDVDVVDFFEAEQIPDIQPGLASGTLNYTQSAEQGMWVFSLQCERYPLNITDFRRALAHLVDKDKYVREGLQGLGYRIDTFLGSPGYGPWSGTDYTTYEFSPTKAGEILDRLGFVRGADGKRIDPKTGTTMRPLVIIARVEHPHRIYAARELAAQMDAIGIPYELNEVQRAVASPRVFHPARLRHLHSWLGRRPRRRLAVRPVLFGVSAKPELRALQERHSRCSLGDAEVRQHKGGMSRRSPTGPEVSFRAGSSDSAVCEGLYLALQFEAQKSCRSSMVERCHKLDDLLLQP
jgi:hypothetical protein